MHIFMKQIHSNECIFEVHTHPQRYLHKTFSHSATLLYFYKEKNCRCASKKFLLLTICDKMMDFSGTKKAKKIVKK